MRTMPKKEIRYVPPKERQRMASSADFVAASEDTASDVTTELADTGNARISTTAAAPSNSTTKHLRRQLENLRRRYVALLAWYAIVSLVVVIMIGFSYNDMTALGVGFILFGVPFFYLFMVEEPLRLSD